MARDFANAILTYVDRKDEIRTRLIPSVVTAIAQQHMNVFPTAAAANHSVVVFLFASTASLLRAIDDPTERILGSTTLTRDAARAQLPTLKILSQDDLFRPHPQYKATAIIMATWVPLEAVTKESAGDNNNTMQVFTATVLCVP